MWFIKEAPKVINLSLGSPADIERFKADVGSNHSLSIWTHPFYSEALQNQPEELSYRNARDNAMQAQQAMGQPMLILEGYDAFPELRKRLKRSGLHENVYSLRTPPTDPVPLGLGWDKLADLLSQTQLTSLEAGGEYLMFFGQEDGKYPRLNSVIQQHQTMMSEQGVGKLFDKDGNLLTLVPRFCVGITAVELVKRGYDVKFSLPAYPNKLWRETEFFCA